jgi:Zn-dependent protease with chaperone function
MRALILSCLLFPLAAAPLARSLTTRIEPKLATWLLSGAALLLAGTSCGALGLLVLSPLVRMPWLARLGHWSSTIVAGAGLPGGWTSRIAAVALGAALLAAGAFVVRRARALADVRKHARSLPGGSELVVTGDDAADAYAVPGRPGRIVVSTGMLQALDDPGRMALLAHERAHLAGRHHWFTSAARLAAAANPMVRPLATAVEYTVERWADESAASAVGDRHTVARAIASAAIAAKATKARSARAGALGVLGGAKAKDILAATWSRLPRATRRAREHNELAGAGPVPRRVAALLAPAPSLRQSLPALAPALLFLAAVAVCAFLAADSLQDLISLAHASAK